MARKRAALYGRFAAGVALCSWAHSMQRAMDCIGQALGCAGLCSVYAKHCAKPCSKIPRGRSCPMNTMRLQRFSSSRQSAPTSLPMS